MIGPAQIRRQIGSSDRQNTRERWFERPRERAQLIHLGAGKDYRRRVIAGRSSSSRTNGRKLRDADGNGDEERDRDQDFDERESFCASTERTSDASHAVALCNARAVHANATSTCFCERKRTSARRVRSGSQKLPNLREGDLEETASPLWCVVSGFSGRHVVRLTADSTCDRAASEA
jgi:hypothetical protein